MSILWSGKLDKRGFKRNKGFKERFFSLNDHGNFSYFKVSSDGTHKQMGTICLNHNTSICPGKTLREFVIDEGSRTWFLRADTNDIATECKKSLNAAIKLERDSLKVDQDGDALSRLCRSVEDAKKNTEYSFSLPQGLGIPSSILMTHVSKENQKPMAQLNNLLFAHPSTLIEANHVSTIFESYNLSGSQSNLRHLNNFFCLLILLKVPVSDVSLASKKLCNTIDKTKLTDDNAIELGICQEVSQLLFGTKFDARDIAYEFSQHKENPKRLLQCNFLIGQWENEVLVQKLMFVHCLCHTECPGTSEKNVQLLIAINSQCVTSQAQIAFATCVGQLVIRRVALDITVPYLIKLCKLEKNKIHRLLKRVSVEECVRKESCSYLIVARRLLESSPYYDDISNCVKTRIKVERNSPVRTILAADASRKRTSGLISLLDVELIKPKIEFDPVTLSDDLIPFTVECLESGNLPDPDFFLQLLLPQKQWTLLSAHFGIINPQLTANNLKPWHRSLKRSQELFDVLNPLVSLLLSAELLESIPRETAKTLIERNVEHEKLIEYIPATLLSEFSLHPNIFNASEPSCMKELVLSMAPIPEATCVKLVKYGHLLDNEYVTFIKESWDRFQEDTIIQVLSLAYPKHHKVAAELIQNVEAKLGSSSEPVFTAMIQKNHNVSIHELLNGMLQLWDVPKLGEILLEKVFKNPPNQWVEQIRELNFELYSEKFPEKDFNQVIQDFKDADYPLAKEDLVVFSQYQTILEVFLKNKYNEIESHEQLEEVLMKERENLPSSHSRTLTDAQIRILGLIRQAVFLEKGYNPYNTQMVVVLLLLRTKLQGRLAQVCTGQGKSIIVGMIAAFYCLHGNYIDIVTTSPMLAIRDAKEMKKFFSIFGVTCWHCCSDNKTHEEHFAPQIIYGTPFHFEWATLMDEYDQKEVRKPRPFDIVIIDEVDSMLVDKSSNSTKIIYSAEIYQRVIWVYKWLFDEAQHCTDGEKLMERLQDSHCFKACSSYIQKFIRTNGKYWCSSAVRCAHMHEGDAYVVKDDAIKPVDASHTGEIQERTSYISGLHQLLEHKHDLYPSLGHLSGCQQSHSVYFGRYTKILGLSGTMGSSVERGELNHFYELDTFDAPLHIQGTRQSWPSILSQTRSSWMQDIANECLEASRFKRPVLVIMEAIMDTRELFAILLPNSDALVQLLSGEQDEEAEVVIAKSGRPSMITVATNMAGRGADIRTTKESEVAGGLHVVITFSPSNSRVKAQAEGRTARQGNRGSFRYIFNYETLEDAIDVPLSQLDDHLTDQRRHFEAVASKKRITVYGPIVLARSNMVEWVCSEIPKWDKAGEFVSKGCLAQWTDFWSMLEQYCTDKERVICADDVPAFIDEINEKFKDMKNELNKSIKQKRPIKHPHIFLDRAEHYIKNERLSDAMDDIKASLDVDKSHVAGIICLIGIFQAQEKIVLAKQWISYGLKRVRNVLKLCDYDIYSLGHKMTLHRLEGDTKSAKEARNRIFEIIHKRMAGNRLDMLFSFADTLRDMENFEMACEVNQIVVDGWKDKNPPHPKFYLALNDLGFAQTQCKKFSLARNSLNWCLEILPGYANGEANLLQNYVSWSWAFIKDSRLPEAMKVANGGLKRFPRRGLLVNTVGCIYTDQKLFERALLTFQDALTCDLSDSATLVTTINQNLSWCNRKWAWHLKEQKQYSLALEKANEAIRLRSNFSCVFNTRGCIYLKMEDKKMAKKDFLLAISFEPNGTPDHATYTANLKLAQN